MLPLTVILVLGVLAQQAFAYEPDAIDGGQRAAPGEFPWQCSLNVNGTHICGCTIIGRDKILTAAHCLYGIASPPYNNLRILTGNIYINQGQSHRVQSVRIHPQYVPNEEETWVNDVAVITIQGKIRYDDIQSSIPLASAPPRPGSICTLSGWELTSPNGRHSSQLLKMDQTIIRTEKCQAIHRVKFFGSYLCAYNKYEVGACEGDSGSPLVCNGRLYGITSWVLPCAIGAPNAYISVFYHLFFIMSS